MIADWDRVVRAFLPSLVLLDRLRVAALADDLVWVVPTDLFPHLDTDATVYGIPIVTGDVDRPALAHYPEVSR